MIEYRFADESYRADLIDFINYVFSQAHQPHDFKTLIPKVYADGRGYADIHAIALCDGRVHGVVAQLPISAVYGGQPLSIGYIGSVSTYPYTRGSGHMIRLMAMQAEHAQEAGIDVMMLSGQRQRYEYYGYSPAGSAYNYHINSSNVRHALKNVEVGNLTCKRFQDASEAEIDAAYRIYSVQPISGIRSREDFDIILRTWGAEPYVLLDGETVVGYADAQGKESVNELILTDASFAPCFVKAWFALFAPDQLTVTVPPYERALNRALAAFAESSSLSEGSHVRIVNLKNVLLACLSLKKATTGISDGKLVLQMDDETPLCVKVENGEITVTETDAKPDVALPRLSMQQFLFAFNRFSAPEANAPAGWFPLPLDMYSADHF